MEELFENIVNKGIKVDIPCEDTWYIQVTHQSKMLEGVSMAGCQLRHGGRF